MSLFPCRECQREISDEAFSCPHCGAPHPARATWAGTGFEYRSRLSLLSVPLVHVAFGRDGLGRPRVAHGFVAIGQVAFGFVAVAQFGVGVVTIAQFGIGLLFGLGQFVLASVAVAQFAAGFVAKGWFVLSLAGAHPLLTSLHRRVVLSGVLRGLCARL